MKGTLQTGCQSYSEDLLINFIDELRDSSHGVTVELVTIEAMKANPEFRQGNFSLVRLDRFDYLIREKTRIAQMPVDASVCLDFVAAVNKMSKMRRVDPSLLINMDETPLYNDQKPKKTIANKGQKVVHVLKSRTGDFRSTVILAVTRDILEWVERIYIRPVYQQCSGCKAHTAFDRRLMPRTIPVKQVSRN